MYLQVCTLCGCMCTFAYMHVHPVIVFLFFLFFSDLNVSENIFNEHLVIIIIQ